MTQEPNTVTFAKDEPIGFERTADNKLVVSGYSIHTGIFQNGMVEIPYSELTNIAETLKGQKFLKNHNSYESEAVIGRIVETKIGLDKNIGKKGVKYKGVIRDAELESKIQDGFLDNVSIGFELRPECSLCGEDFRYCEHWFDEAHVIARDCKCYEQSIVPFGADNNTTIQPGANFSHDNDFSMQFAYKQETSGASWKYDGQTSTGTTSGWDYTYDFAPLQSIPATNITFTFAAPEDKGDNMEEEVKRLEGEIEGKDAEITRLTQENEQLAAEKAELESTIEERDGQISELEGQVGELQGVITAYEDAEKEAEEAEKLAAAQEIVKLEQLEGEEAEERLKELTEKFDTPALKEIAAARLSVKPVAEEEPKIGQFHAQKSEPAMPEKTEEIDVEAPEARKIALGQMFNMSFRKKE